MTVPNDAPEPEPAIVLSDVTKAFGDHLVLDGVSLTVKPRSITVLLGPSGTGKSVLLRIIVGLLRPDRGSVWVGRDDVAALDERRARDRERLFAVRRKFGMLFQDGALFDDLTVFENVAFPLRMHTRLAEDEIRARVADKLARVGLPRAGSKFPAELSGGMRKRAAFARAIALEPSIVLCDEPSSGLDPVMSATLDALILEMHRTLGISFVVISHDTAEALAIADTIGMLAGGRLVHYGPRAELEHGCHPALQQFFDRTTVGPIKVV